jgi:Zn-dependent M28 family amino/carboxypeptidase
MIVHETGPAGYPYAVVEGSFSREQFDVPSPTAGDRVPVEGWLSLDKAKQIIGAAGYDFDSLKAAAATKDFRPVTLDARASFDVDIGVRRIQSKNVLAKLEGSTRPDEYVVYTAHWDHLGRDTTAQGDQIFNGALDNASGTSALLEIAEAFAALDTAPSRSILFLAVTAEEKGLLGAKYYASNPLYPLDRTVANINMDGINQWGRTSDVVVVGSGTRRWTTCCAGCSRPRTGPSSLTRSPRRGFLPLRPLRVRQAGRARALRRCGHGLRRQARGVRHAEAGGVHLHGLSRALRRSEARLGMKRTRASGVQ